MDSQVYNEEMSKMDRPIPGMSLTNDPENPAPYEKPTEFTNVHEACQYLWSLVTEDETYEGLMTGLSKGVPLMPIVETILFDEFRQGKWNPDLMLMLVEPFAYMIIALAERLNIDVDIDGEEDEVEVFGVSVQEEKLNKLREAAGPAKKAPVSFLTQEQLAEMKSLPTIPSLLESNQTSPETPDTQPEAQTTQQPSLMAPTEGQ